LSGAGLRKKRSGGGAVTQVLRLRTDLDVIDFEAYGFVEERPFMAA